MPVGVIGRPMLRYHGGILDADGKVMGVLDP